MKKYKSRESLGWASRGQAVAGIFVLRLFPKIYSRKTRKFEGIQKPPYIV